MIIIWRFMNFCVHTVCMPTIQAKNLTLDGNWCPESTELRMRAHNQVSMTGNDLSGLPPVYMYTLGSFMAVNCIFENFDKLVVACNFGLRYFSYSSDYFVQKKNEYGKVWYGENFGLFFVQMTNWHYRESIKRNLPRFCEDLVVVFSALPEVGWVSAK